MKKVLILLLALAMVLGLAGCGDDASIGIIGGADGPTAVFVGGALASGDDDSGEEDPVDSEDAIPAVPEGEADNNPPEEEESILDEEGWYYSAEEVSYYLWVYGHLPDNFITKNEARDLGWEGGSVEKYAPGYAIGGDRFGNREGLLPEDRTYYECDIDTDGQDSRGAKRLVFSDDLIYYTEDHYESFELLYGEE